MADLAQQAGIARERRQALGKWESEEETDVYARTFRTQILGVWMETLAKIDELDVGGGRWFSEDQPDPNAAQLPHGPAASEILAPAPAANQDGPPLDEAQRWKDVLQEAGIDPVALYAGEVLFPPLIMNKSTDRIHWVCRETVDSLISGKVCNKF